MKKKILVGLSLLFGLMFIHAGLNTFFAYMPPPADMPEDSMQMFTAMLQIGWLMPLVGAVQILGGVMFIIPRSRALAAVIVFPVMAGIMISHFVVAPEGLPTVLPLFAILIWVISENREKYLPMIMLNQETKNY